MKRPASPNLLRLLPLIVVLFLACAAPLRAHDTYEVTMTATIRPATMDLVLTFAGATALRLTDAPPLRAPLTPEHFAALRPKLTAAASELFALTSAQKTLALRTTALRLTEENDIEFTLTYPRPAAGPLQFRPAFLARLGEGYGGLLEVADTAGHHLGWEMILSEKDAPTVTVPPAPAP